MSQNSKILVADDDQLFRQIVTRQLKKRGYELVTSNNGKEAFELALEFHPDIIISDWLMPEMNGEELCNKIKQHEKLKWIYFILVTIRDKIDDLTKVLDFGADDYIAKPCDTQELIARVRTGLRIIALQKDNIRLQRIEAINQTAVTANHEINNPLQTIIGATELILLQDQNISKSAKENLVKIQESTVRIRKVTKKLEQLIKSESIDYISNGPKMIDLNRSVSKEM